MIHATDVGPGGLRYIAVNHACVASGDDEPISPKLGHGRAYQLDPRELAAAVKDVPMGGGAARDTSMKSPLSSLEFDSPPGSVRSVPI